jgi:hypothetical protein
LKSSIHFIIQQIPSIFINSTFSQFNKTPKSWNDILLLNDIAEITKNINNLFNTFNSSPFSNITPDSDIYYQNFLNQINIELFGVYDFLNNFPILSHIVKDEAEFYYFMDMNTITLLFQYCWLLVIDTYINIADNRPVLAVINKPNNDPNELNEIDIINTTTDIIYPAFFKKDVAVLISTFINNFKNTNDITNISYENIRDKVNIMKQKEKKNLATKFLGKLSREELRIENELKQFKLGNWSENIHFFRYNKAHETEARKLLDQYIDYDDTPQDTTPLANDNDDENAENPEEYMYGADGDGYDDDEYDPDEYDNEDYSNNDDFDT